MFICLNLILIVEDALCRPIMVPASLQGFELYLLLSLHAASSFLFLFCLLFSFFFCFLPKCFYGLTWKHFYVRRLHCNEPDNPHNTHIKANFSKNKFELLLTCYKFYSKAHTIIQAFWFSHSFPRKEVLKVVYLLMRGGGLREFGFHRPLYSACFPTMDPKCSSFVC